MKVTYIDSAVKVNIDSIKPGDIVEIKKKRYIHDDLNSFVNIYSGEVLNKADITEFLNKNNEVKLIRLIELTR